MFGKIAFIKNRYLSRIKSLVIFLKLHTPATSTKLILVQKCMWSELSDVVIEYYIGEGGPSCP